MWELHGAEQLVLVVVGYVLTRTHFQSLTVQQFIEQRKKNVHIESRPSFSRGETN